ncbi:hypothetical protein E1180_01950 [Roseibium denhamense]|nr:DUF6665 family protein [Roseibium denhamense]MTI04279.1 hypothetical protein [Roseibium denhamense]
MRPPRSLTQQDQDPLTAALEQEVFNEKASTLFRLNKKLEDALAALEAARETFEPDDEHFRHVHAQAGEALWNVTIQRELCGLKQHKAFYDHLNVPGSVRLAMGPAILTRPSRK